MSAVWGKLFGNRPTPANDAQHLSTYYEPDNETSEAWGRVIERFGASSQAGRRSNARRHVSNDPAHL